QMLFSADGKALAFQAGRGAPIVVLDTVTGKQTATLPSLPAAVVLQGVLSPDGRCLAIERTTGAIALYELATGQLRCTFLSERSDRRSFTKVPAALLDSPFAEALGDFGIAAKTGVNVAISPDGRLLAHPGPGSSVRICDTLTGKELTLLKGHTRPVNALAFAPDGKRLASASDDTTALIWDVTRIARPAQPARVVPPAELENWWQLRADNDATKAFAAMGEFATVPNDAAAWIRDRVRPVAPLDMKRVETLIRQLNAGQFRERETATSELLKMGEEVLPAIEKGLAAKPSLEAKSRLEAVRAKLSGIVLSGEGLRGYRAVELLERIGTPQARHVLQTLANGAPGALLTTSAQAALRR